jgi:hypothetical protein
MSTDTTLRLGLAALGISAFVVGAPALLVPEGFFDEFPFVAEWVRLLGVYNEHLVTDVGGLYMGFAALFLWAAYRPSPELAVPLCVAWTFVATAHLVFHLIRLDGFNAGDAVAQSLSLALVAVLPLILLRRMRSGIG